MQVYTGAFNNQTILKCTNCNVPIHTEGDYKTHYKSEFHRYNIKRKMLGLKPATQQQFISKKGENQIEEANQPKGTQLQCKPCRKTFTNQGMFKQHLQSKKHSEQKVRQVVDKKDKKSKRQIISQLCLFCENKAISLLQNLGHMQRSHGFFVPQKEFCKDVEGLIKYLHEKVQVGLLCIYCENKGFKDFQSSEAIRCHMKDKSHSFMNVTNGFQQFQKYYDFGRLFDERVQEQKKYRLLPGLQSDVVEVIIPQKKESNKQSKKQAKQNTINNQSKNEEDGQNEEQWEDDGEDENQLDQNDEQWSDVSQNQDSGENIAEIKQEKLKPKTKKYVMYKPTVLQNGELLLPSGKLLGTRKYRHLYKQYYRPLLVEPNRRKMLTDGGISSALVLRSERLQIFRQQQRQTRGGRLFQQNRDLKLRLRQNKLQYHFRCQTPK